jgi:hypothetical protein
MMQTGQSLLASITGSWSERPLRVCLDNPTTSGNKQQTWKGREKMIKIECEYGTFEAETMKEANTAMRKAKREYMAKEAIQSAEWDKAYSDLKNKALRLYEDFLTEYHVNYSLLNVSAWNEKNNHSITSESGFSYFGYMGQHYSFCGTATHVLLDFNEYPVAVRVELPEDNDETHITYFVINPYSDKSIAHGAKGLAPFVDKAFNV